MKDFSALRQWVDQAESATKEARERSERDRDFYDEKQWTDQDAATLKKRRQPIITDNRIKPMVNHLLGLEILRRTDPRALPRTPQHEKDAEAATDALRFVEETTDLDRVASAVYKDMLIYGFGGAEVGIETKGDQVEIAVRRYAWDRLGYDPASMEPDFTDARYLYALTWMDYEEAAATWPEAVEVLAQSLSTSPDETYEDKPKETLWKDSSRKRVKICLMYYKSDDGVWHYSLFAGGGEIEGGPSPYLDEDGNPECPLILESAYVDRDNARYGVVRSMVSLQEEHNKRRSKLLHMVSVRQSMAEKGAVDDVRKAKAELQAPDGMVIVNPNKQFNILPNGDQLQGQFALLADTTTSLDRIGPSAMSQGKDERAPSGRAILASQQGNLVELAPLSDGHSRWKRRVYRAIWNRIRQYWKEERWVRVTDDMHGVKFVGINQPITVAEAFIKEMEKAGMSREQAMAQIPQGDPRAQMMFLQNAVADMDVDIIIEEAPDTVTMQYEQFQELTQLAQAGVIFPPKVYIEAAPNLRNKERLLSILDGTEDPEAVQKKQAMEETAIRLQFEQAAANVEKTKAEAAKIAAEGRHEQVETIKTAVEAAATRAQVTMGPI